MVVVVESKKCPVVLILFDGQGREPERRCRGILAIYVLLAGFDAHGGPSRHPADGEVAVGDALHIVAVHVEVGHRIEAPELDRRDVVGLRRFFLCAEGSEIQVLVAGDSPDPRLPSPVLMVPV